MSSFYQRPFHAFLSYSHKDQEIASKFHHWLTRIAGFQIWFDEKNLEVGKPTGTSLSEKMNECRAWIVLASKNSIFSKWVIEERDQAVDCFTNHKEFSIIILRIDECPLNNEWPSISRFKWLEMPNGTPTAALTREIFDRLDRRVWSERQVGRREVFVSRGWRPNDFPFADAVCKALCARKWKLRLVGDMLDQADYDLDRIQEIISSCAAHLAILPQRTTNSVPTDKDYHYFISELEISAKLGIQSFLISESETLLPLSLDDSVIRLEKKEEYSESWITEPPDWLNNFIREINKKPVSQHLFLAAEFKEKNERVENLREFIEAVSGLPCLIGKDFVGQGLINQIVTGVASSTLVIANIARFEQSDLGNSGVNFNTCIEAGIAMGASIARLQSGKKILPVYLTAQCAPEVKNKMDRLPFMFQDSQVTFYFTEAELLGHCRRILLPYRRRIMNYEFSKRN